MSRKSQSYAWPDESTRRSNSSLKSAVKNDLPFVDAARPFV